MSGFNLQEMMQQAKQQAEVLQKKMEQTVVETSSGGGTVTVKMDGRKQLLFIKIDPEAVKAGDVEMLQDLVLAAINEAARKIDAHDAVFVRSQRRGYPRRRLEFCDVALSVMHAERESPKSLRTRDRERGRRVQSAGQ